MQMTKMFRKQVKGINKQVKSLNKQVNKQVKGLGHDFKGLGKDLNRNLNHQLGHMGQKRSGGPGLFTGLLLLGITGMACALLLGKNGRKHRESIKQLFKSEVVSEKISGIGEKIEGTLEGTMQQPVIGKIQTQFHSFLDKVGFAKHESEEPVSQTAGKNGKNGKNDKHSKDSVSSDTPIQTMGEV